MSLTGEELQQRFWNEFPMPSGAGSKLEFRRLETHVVPSSGRTGRWLVDEFQFRYRQHSVRGVLVFTPRLQPAGVPDVSRRLERVVLESLGHRVARDVVRAVAVELASDALLVACRHEQLALFDLSGTIDLASDQVMMQLRGAHDVTRKPRHAPFTTLGTRVIRNLLSTLGAPLPARQLASAVRGSYSSVWTVLAGLEAKGFVQLRRGRGPRVIDPRSLLAEWCARGTPPVREGFYCQNTRVDGLAKGHERLVSLGARGTFTYRSAIAEEDVVTSALPHGLRSTASVEVISEAFSLRRKTPHNFFVLRDAEWSVDADEVRNTSIGPVVSVPQLIFDLHHAGEREREQADTLATKWVTSLPARPLDE